MIDYILKENIFEHRVVAAEMIRAYVGWRTMSYTMERLSQMYSDSLAVKDEKRLVFSLDQVDIADRFREDLEQVASYS